MQTLGILLSSFEFMQTPVCDLDNPVTVNHASSRSQVAMEFDRGVVKVFHALQHKVKTNDPLEEIFSYHCHDDTKQSAKMNNGCST